MRPLDEYPNVQPERCAMCGEDIIWVKGASGIAIPVNPEPDRAGSIVIITGVVQPPLNDLLELIFGPDVRYTNHVMTCTELRAEDGQLRRLGKDMAKSAHPHAIEKCNCGAMFFKAPSAASDGSKKVPLCEHPDPTGNIFLDDQHRAVYVSGKNQPPANAVLYKSHFVDCPHASQFRTKR